MSSTNANWIETEKLGIKCSLFYKIIHTQIKETSTKESTKACSDAIFQTAKTYSDLNFNPNRLKSSLWALKMGQYHIETIISIPSFLHNWNIDIFSAVENIDTS